MVGTEIAGVVRRKISGANILPSHCRKIQDSLRIYPSAQVEKLWSELVRRLDDPELVEWLVCKFIGCWRLITGSSNQVPTLSYVQNGLLRQAENLAEYSRTHNNYVLWEPIPYKEA